MVRFSLISLALLASLFSIALAAPMDETSQLLLANPDGEVHTFACPAWKVRCVKDGKWPSGIVGDIGKKPFCFSGFRCNQCDFDKNTRECNRTFPVECEGRCEAYAPIPF